MPVFLCCDGDSSGIGRVFVWFVAVRIAWVMSPVMSLGVILGVTLRISLGVSCGVSVGV